MKPGRTGEQWSERRPAFMMGPHISTGEKPLNPDNLSASARGKLDVLFEGVRYSEALGEAAEHSFPNFYPYRFLPGENNSTGAQSAPIPYLLTFDDGTMVRIRGDGKSPWSVSGSANEGYGLCHDEDDSSYMAVGFEPLPGWMGPARPPTAFQWRGPASACTATWR